ncbi:hypothetical protein BDW74DRAFT_179570 [Aspergillus multicolor]|uniref:uncharacterized protein n=1 Tax=Aspergillus multicolor TaxID=41759 RepID=UPI003CCD5B21
MSQSIVYRSAKRTFKACRTCRLQKARCIVNTPHPPCSRCRATGRDCVFEEIGSKNIRKRSPDAEYNKNDREDMDRLEELEKQVVELRDLIQDIRRSRTFTSVYHATSTSPPTSPYRSDYPSIANGDLNHMPLDAPITAVHGMASAISSSSQATGRGAACTDSPCSGGTEVMDRLKYQDVISKGLIEEPHARTLFQLYMANANVFLPLFDPLVDTFETVRQQSPFCLVVILAVALRADRTSMQSRMRSKTCLYEAQRLAAQSLFATSARLGMVQGMLLLAVYAECNWFAICHAFEMGRDMGLFDLTGTRRRNTANKSPQGHYDLDRELRTALILYQVEQEVASGTARRPRNYQAACLPLDDDFSGMATTLPFMRIASTIDIVELRGSYLRQLEQQDVGNKALEGMVRSLESDINTWFTKWDNELERLGLHITSFQRSSLRLQKDYAFIIVCSAILSKTGPSSAPGDLIEATLERSIQIMSYISGGNDYKWYLPWAPTYSALFPAFTGSIPPRSNSEDCVRIETLTLLSTASLAYRLARIHLEYIDWANLHSLFTKVASILDKYPYPHYACILRGLSALTAGLVSSNTSPAQGSGDCSRNNRYPRSPTLKRNRPRMDPGQEMLVPGSSANNNYDPYTNATSACIDDGTNGLHGGSDIPSSSGSPGYILDFNSFAASVQASMELELTNSAGFRFE